MHGKRPFPWPQQLPELTLHNLDQQRCLRIIWSERSRVSASVHVLDQGMGIRLDTLLKVGSGIATLLRQRHRQGFLEIQLHDEEPLTPCLRLDASSDEVNDPSRPLIPDPYCLMTGGYRALRKRMQADRLPPWSERLPIAFWRGSTTGSKGIDLNSLELNRRYQLARLSRAWPDRLDARINRAVQCRSAQDRERIVHRLQREGLLSITVHPWHAALHAWQIDIDGNVNSWGLLWKLLSGSCILRVQSPRRQWYHHRLKPWVHLVPVNADLSDLGERLTWCNNHRQECAAIAAAGKALAENVVQEIDEELLSAGVRYAQAWL